MRRDLADVRLADRVFAPHYAVPHRCRVVLPAPLVAEPRGGFPALSEVLPGEHFAVLELGREHAWGTAADGAVGYVSTDALGSMDEPTHAVAVPLAQPRGAGTPLPMGARLGGTVSGGLLEADCGSYDLIDLRPIDRPAGDPVAVAEALVGVAYKPGGRSGLGLDGAGLIYLAFSEAGHDSPRFGDEQASVGQPLPDDAALRRGDIVLFADHAGIMADPDMLIHATPAGVTCEPLQSVAAGAFGPITGRQRP